jgi:hypothetical protein
MISYHGGRGSITGQVTWDFWVGEVVLGQVSSEYFGIPCQLSYLRLLQFHRHHHHHHHAVLIQQQRLVYRAESISASPLHKHKN